MDDTLGTMRLLVEAADSGSLSEAARRLRLPLATVSRRIAALERRLGARLLNRTTRRLAPTAAGIAYLEACRRVLDAVAAAEREVAGAASVPRGTLAVTAPLVFGRLHLVPVLAGFMAAHPEVSVRLRLLDRPVDLIEERLDAALRIGELPDSGLMAIRLGAVRRVTCASAAYLAARGVPLVPADLARHDCITPEGLHAPELWRFSPGAVRVRSRLVVNTPDAAIAAAVAGLGVTRVLSYQAAALGEGALRLVLEEFEPPAWPVQLVHMAGAGPALRAFLDYATPRLRAALAGLSASSTSPGRPEPA